MRTLILLLILSSCDGNMFIRNKNYKTDKECICNYEYIEFGNTAWFQDSCNKYNIGDKIK